ncbi:cytosolic phospholipase A2 gamma-like [Ambystoma mexicanum]|uniref:cytosolic phospholipase A2 gamma-like n=1 Tax=Ambystoma mexicanum TaxID=8296 RepID=UPI0037E9ACB2
MSSQAPIYQMSDHQAKVPVTMVPSWANRTPESPSALIRWSKELSDGELISTSERRRTIAQCLAKHGISCDVDRVPRVALLGSGGGLRAMIALMGTLMELATQDLLDSIMYLCGVSGSTWCMSSVYEDVLWSRNVNACERRMKESLNSSSRPKTNMWQKIEHAIEEGVYSLTNLWGQLVGSRMIKHINENKLANHKGACEHGMNPYPIYAAVDKAKIKDEFKHVPGTWFEFTPHYSGFTDFGAFVKTEAIGSHFEKGNLLARKAEKTICYLQGLWGSALANEQDIKSFIKDSIDVSFRGDDDEDESTGTLSYYTSASEHGEYTYARGFHNMAERVVAACSCKCCLATKALLGLSNDELEGEAGKKALLTLETLLAESERDGTCHMTKTGFSPRGFFTDALSSVGERMKIIAKLMKCLIKWQWGTTHNFLYKCSDQDASIPTALTSQEYIHLIDAGLAINSAYPLVLRPERKVDLILSFDFSAGDPFATLKESAEYCRSNKIPFPIITLDTREENYPSGCYIFKGPNVPTVMHFPLFNVDNCPGEIQDYKDIFSTFQTSYGRENVDNLLRLSKMTVQKHKDKILQELAQAVHAG